MDELKIHDNVFPFVCDKCKKEYDLEGFTNVVLLWGFIYLTKGEHNLIGMTCPDCHYTTLRKYPLNTPDFSMEALEKSGIKYYVPFSAKILTDLSLITLPNLQGDENKEDSYRIPFGFKPRSYSKYVDDEYFIVERIIPELLKIEHEYKWKAFPRVVPQHSVYKHSDAWLIEFDQTKDIPTDILEAMNEAMQFLLDMSLARSHYDHMIRSDLSLDKYRDLNIGDYSWQREAFKENVHELIKEYKTLRNQIDFELICYNELINKFARIFYHEPGFGNRQMVEHMSFEPVDDSELVEPLSDEELNLLQIQEHYGLSNGTEKSKPVAITKPVFGQVEKKTEDIEKPKKRIGFVDGDVKLPLKEEKAKPSPKIHPAIKVRPLLESIETVTSEEPQKSASVEPAKDKKKKLQPDKKAGIRDSEISREDYEALMDQVSDLEDKYPALKAIIAINPQMMKLKLDIIKPAILDTDILILGKTGTGKGLFAKAIHEISDRDGKLVKQNCAGLSDNTLESELFGHVKGAYTGAHKRRLGAFQIAIKGTLFLDELAKMSLKVQTKLLNAVDEKEIKPLGGDETVKVQLNFVYAANENLEDEIKEGRFLEDLFYRVDKNRFKIPRLRDRVEDIPVLADYFLNHFNKKFKKQIKHFSPEVMGIFKKYIWEGNVRELMHTIEEAMVKSKGTQITIDNLPDKLRHEDFQTKSKSEDNLFGNTKIKDYEVIYWMKREKENKTHVAQKLGVDRVTISRRWKKINR